MTVPKKKGKFRICGDLKVTINPVLDVEHYPLPKPQDLFASLTGGQKFTKLDLQQAYLQLPLEEESQKYVTVNTHRGLFQYTRLPFGITTAPSVFQKTMDTMLHHMQDLSEECCDTALRRLTNILAEHALGTGCYSEEEEPPPSSLVEEEEAEELRASVMVSAQAIQHTERRQASSHSDQALFALSITHNLTHSPARSLTHAPTHPPTHSLTHSLTHSIL